ncbi:MAG: hypothetical protein GC146_16300 [Limimaricola sp.]|uniref:hypothetical protein n=1 Tax=Limimaricola sp. TaxID=2211665 RepID=UPI001D582A0E|nr:hypothetical protein [Limimaricola sp.]MBI1418778.1 hypothetical protein [Limimaricola sp.]
MSWKNRIASCFGEKDLIFAGHPSDEESAYILLGQLRKEGVGWRELREALEEHLRAQSASDTHAEKQLEKARGFMKPWLLD